MRLLRYWWRFIFFHSVSLFLSSSFFVNQEMKPQNLDVVLDQLGTHQQICRDFVCVFDEWFLSTEPIPKRNIQFHSFFWHSSRTQKIKIWRRLLFIVPFKTWCGWSDNNLWFWRLDHLKNGVCQIQKSWKPIKKVVWITLWVYSQKRQRFMMRRDEVLYWWGSLILSVIFSMGFANCNASPTM